MGLLKRLGHIYSLYPADFRQSGLGLLNVLDFCWGAPPWVLATVHSTPFSLASDYLAYRLAGTVRSVTMV